MKNADDTRLLAHKRRIDAQRKAAWRVKQAANNAAALRKVGGAEGCDREEHSQRDVFAAAMGY